MIQPCEQARFNWVVLHCIAKLIPGKDWYDLGGELIGGSGRAALAAAGLTPAGGAVGGLRQCFKKRIGDFSAEKPDCHAAGKSASEGSVGGAIGNGIKCSGLTDCIPGGGALTWAIECELELMELVECKGRSR